VDDSALSDVERTFLTVSGAWDNSERGYSAIQSTQPQTIGYGLTDSPAGLAAYLSEKWHSWSDEFLQRTTHNERRNAVQAPSPAELDGWLWGVPGTVTRSAGVGSNCGQVFSKCLLVSGRS
jgi:hypothetical protein